MASPSRLPLTAAATAAVPLAALWPGLGPKLGSNVPLTVGLVAALVEVLLFLGWVISSDVRTRRLVSLVRAVTRQGRDTRSRAPASEPGRRAGRKTDG
jgi:hypothetical protein